LLVLSRGVGYGRRVALHTVIGMTLAAGAMQLPLLAVGVASILRSSPLAFELLRWTGAFYLVWLGAKLATRRCSASGGSGECPKVLPALTAVREGMLANLT